MKPQRFFKVVGGKWALTGGIFFIFFPLFLPGHLLAQSDQAVTIERVRPLAETSPAAGNGDVFLCRRLVDDWRVQLLFPGIEHYSIWLPRPKLHRGVVAEGLGDPLRWVDEFYFDPNASAADIARQGYTCDPIPQADIACVERQMTRRRAEGWYGLTYQCQNVALDLLALCGGQLPPLTPAFQISLLSSAR
jgi:hypothetical protein